jgi:methyltransferase (TIGR00027 family)
MIESLPSFSALYVAFARGIATHDSALSRACKDPLAGRLLPRALRAVIRTAERSPAAARALRYSSLGMFDHHAMRTGVIDRWIETALERGARQLVLLGAGLDTRGHRMQRLTDAVVYEVDHADTQAFKRSRAGALELRAREIRYVSCDFQRSQFDEALTAAGFDASLPSCFVWEGVTMYLTESAFERSLAALSELCIPRSALILTYLTTAPELRRSAAWAPVHGLLSAIAEPVRFTCDVESMEARLRNHGFRTLADNQPLAQRTTFEVEPLQLPIKNPLERERVVCAERVA